MALSGQLSRAPRQLTPGSASARVRAAHPLRLRCRAGRRVACGAAAEQGQQHSDTGLAKELQRQLLEQRRLQILRNGEGPEEGAAYSFSSYSSFEDTPVELDEDEEVVIEHEAQRLRDLLEQLRARGSLEEKVALLDDQTTLAQFYRTQGLAPLWNALGQLPLEEQYVLKCLPAIGQRHLLVLPPADGKWLPPLRRLASALCRVEHFYDSMGGLVGYQLKSLELIAANSAAAAAADATSAAGSAGGAPAAAAAAPEMQYHVPPALDLAGEAGRRVGVRAAAHGILALPFMAEILPVGGAGDRLGLKDDVTGESLPAAVLPYTGRPMMEILIRDLQAREYLYWQLTGRQITTPLAVMTSDAKGNHQRITGLMERNRWFGRDPGSFRLFRQPLVPVISSEDGRWLMTAPFKAMMKPGGHGAIWKLMHDEGVFDWLRSSGREAALVRQISNPMAGVDTTLLALAGTGYIQRRAFGFMSCERVVGAAEGMNVLQEKKTWAPDGQGGGKWRYEYAVTNVEYTEFERLGIQDMAVDDSSNHSVFPANTNILYVGLDAARAKVEAAVAAGGGDVLPGLIFNMKKKVKYFDPLVGAERAVYAGRMECTMQNLADAMVTSSEEPLPVPPHAPGGGDGLADALNNGEGGLADRLDTFLVYNMRRKVTSSAKKRREPGSTRIHQTPDGSFYDLMRNGWQVLQRCGMRYVPEVGDVQRYLESGPGFMFLFHPALGPLWDVIAQKIRGGAVMDGSELVMEVAEARLVDVTVDGSLLVMADDVMGHWEEAPAAAAAEGGSMDGEDALMLDAAAAAAAGVTGGKRLVYSSSCGRVHMMNVTVQNVGVDWHHPGNCYWRHQVQRHESCRVILRGRSEFEAFDCRITGNQVFEVPDGHRMVVTAGPRGALQRTLVPLMGDAPSWEWRYTMDDGGDVRCEFHRNAALELFGDLAAPSAGSDEDAVLDFII